MSLAPLRWLGKNVSALLLAFLLAMVVWVSAVIVDDPNIERPLARPVPIEFIGKDANLKLMGEYPTTVNLVLLAPQSVWKRLDNEKDSIRAWVDLSNLGAGEVDVPVRVHINLKLVRQISQDPEHLHLLLEPVISEIFPVVLAVNGEPPIGYKASPVQMDPAQVTVSGPASLVGKVKEVRASLDIAGAVETLIKIVAVSALDASGRTVSGVNVNPSSVTVTQGISLLGGYRNVIVKVNTTGIVASGYRLTNYLPSPSSIIVFSSDPQLVSALPGYIETELLDLTGAKDDFEALLELHLPEGVSAVGGSKVLVQVSIAAIESSMAISLPVEITGLSPIYEVQLAPAIVDVLLSGPVPVLNGLKPSDIRVKVDLTSYGVGVHQIMPVVDFLPAGVRKESILPATLEVTISLAPTQTPTITPSPSVTITPTSTLTPTPLGP